ncbi:MAG: NAD(P)H-dependent oxidoreductase [Alphaproteobacteria bacterium]|nr:NAD(P)H-dependent oxidoreductase [Alphaproteobacteria bacterium]
MKEILWLNCSARGAASLSFQAGQKMIASLTRQSPGAHVNRRDLATDAIPFIDAAYTAHMYLDETAARDEPSLQVSEALIKELMRADILVVSTPMHNFTVPAPLKAWIDQVLRINRTFVRTPRGKEGLLTDKPSYILVSAGGGVLGEDAGQPDFLTPYLHAVLKTIGLTDVSFFYLEKMAGGAPPPQEVFDALQLEISERLSGQAELATARP